MKQENDPQDQVKSSSNDSRSSISGRDSDPSTPVLGFTRVFVVALMGSVLLWLSFAPVGIWPLAWFAIAPWCWLIHTPHLSGRRRGLAIWLAGFIYWLATIYFVPIPHPALWAGWVVFSLYLSTFLPLFIGLSRVLVHRFGVSPLIAVPVVWTGIEFLRSNYIVAFGTILLGHSQFKFPLLIQTADLFGMYTVSFLMALFTMAVTIVWTRRDSLRASLVPATIAVLVMVGMCSYGFWRLGQDREDPDSPVVRLALIQGSIDTLFPDTEDEAEQLRKRHIDQYRDLTWEARTTAPDLDLIVWPETIFLSAYVVPEDEARIDDDLRERIQYAQYKFRENWLDATGVIPIEKTVPPTRWNPIAMMTGVPGYAPVDKLGYNSAVLIDADGEVRHTYSKRHLVIFGEYVPFAKWFPILNEMTPIQDGTAAGDSPKCFPFGGLNFAPNICFESTVPHMLRRDVIKLASQGQEPDVMVNLTNDGWFFGTACLDHHLACNVFRSVELRKPMLVCANTGFSAVVDSAGQIQNQGPRREVGILYVNAVREKKQFSLYLIVGDWLAWLMGMTCLGTLVLSCVKRKAWAGERNSP